MLFEQKSKLDLMEEIFPWIVCTLVLKSLTDFLRKNITIVGTVQKLRVGFPEEVFDTKIREVLRKPCHFEYYKKDLCLSSYTVQTTSKGKKNVVILSTTRPIHSCTKDDNKSKHQIFKLYDFTKV